MYLFFDAPRRLRVDKAPGLGSLLARISHGEG